MYDSLIQSKYRLICSHSILTLCPIVFPPLKQSFKLRQSRKKLSKSGYIFLAASKTSFQSFQFFFFLFTLTYLWHFRSGTVFHSLRYWQTIWELFILRCFSGYDLHCLKPEPGCSHGPGWHFTGKGHEAPAYRSVWRPKCCVLRYIKFELPTACSLGWNAYLG